jgi:hypothetical protein
MGRPGYKGGDAGLGTGRGSVEVGRTGFVPMWNYDSLVLLWLYEGRWAGSVFPLYSVYSLTAVGFRVQVFQHVDIGHHGKDNSRIMFRSQGEEETIAR